MTRFIVSVFPFRNRVSSPEAFEGLELGEGKLSRPVLRGPDGRKAAWLLGSYQLVGRISTGKRASIQDFVSSLADFPLPIRLERVHWRFSANAESPIFVLRTDVLLSAEWARLLAALYKTK